MSWTAERVEILKQGVAEGLSYTEISQRLNGVFSRSACIGKAKRMGLAQPPAATRFNRAYAPVLGVTWADQKGREEVLQRRSEMIRRARAEPPRAAPRPAAVEMGQGHHRTPPALPPRDLPQIDAFDLSPDPIPLVGRPFGRCAWPVGEPERPADQLCCGARTGGKTYCDTHARLGGAKYGRGVMGPERELLHALRSVA